MVKVIDGVRYANGEEPRTTTAGPGVPRHSPFGELEKRIERLEELVGVEKPDESAPEGVDVTGEPTGEKPDEKQDGEPPAKRPTARRVETK